MKRNFFLTNTKGKRSPKGAANNKPSSNVDGSIIQSTESEYISTKAISRLVQQLENLLVQKASSDGICSGSDFRLENLNYVDHDLNLAKVFKILDQYIEGQKMQKACRLIISAAIRHRMHKRLNKFLQKTINAYYKSDKPLAIDYDRNRMPSKVYRRICSDIWWQINEFYPGCKTAHNANIGLIENVYLTSTNRVIVSGFSTVLNERTFLVDNDNNFYPMTKIYSSWPKNKYIRKCFSALSGNKGASEFSACFTVKSNLSLLTLIQVHETRIEFLSETVDIIPLSTDLLESTETLYYNITKYASDKQLHISNIEAQYLLSLKDSSMPISEYVHRESSLTQSCANYILDDNIIVSIVIPIYKRIDLVGIQLMHLSRDLDGQSNVEVIYVCDDPDNFENLESELRWLSNLYKISIRLIEGYRSGGYAKAANCGARNAKGAYILFMDSDIIPFTRGFIQSLHKELITTPNSGLSSPLLLRTDDLLGVLQRDLTCEPVYGLYKTLDFKKILPADFQQEISSLDSALIKCSCVMIERKLFFSIGCWSEQYLPADYTDSDLCVKIMKAGKTNVICQNISVYHLEEQSFIELSDDSEYKSHLKEVNRALFNALHKDYLFDTFPVGSACRNA